MPGLGGAKSWTTPAGAGQVRAPTRWPPGAEVHTNTWSAGPPSASATAAGSGSASAATAPARHAPGRGGRRAARRPRRRPRRRPARRRSRAGPSRPRPPPPRASRGRPPPGAGPAPRSPRGSMRVAAQSGSPSGSASTSRAAFSAGTRISSASPPGSMRVRAEALRTACAARRGTGRRSCRGRGGARRRARRRAKGAPSPACDDLARGLVAQDHRRARVLVPGHQVAAAEAAGAHPHDQLARRRRPGRAAPPARSAPAPW